MLNLLKILIPTLLLSVGFIVKQEQKQQEILDIKFKQDSIKYNKPKLYFWTLKPKQYPRGDKQTIYLTKEDYKQLQSW